MVTSELHARRRRRTLVVCAALAAVAGGFVGSRTGDEPAARITPPTVCERSDSGAMALIAGQRVMVRMEALATNALRRQAREGEIGGVILFPPSDIQGERLAAEIQKLQAAAELSGNPPLLVAIDQEGGIVERLPALAPQLSPYSISIQNRPQAARLEGRATGFQLRELGINVNLAPVLDVPSSAEQFLRPPRPSAGAPRR